MSMFIETIKPEHECRHVPDSDPQYNESTYYNFASLDSGVVGWLRVAVQPNQPSGQATGLVFLPSGDTLLSFERTRTFGSEQLAVGSISIEVLEPHRRQQLTFDGTMSVFTDPRVLSSPRQALADAPVQKVRIDLANVADGASFGTNGDDPGNFLEETLALGHYEQFGRLDGRILIGDQVFEVQGGGLRDHSWGPRDWTGPLFHRWITAILDDGTQIMTLEVGRRDGSLTRRAAITKDDQVYEAILRGLTIDWTDDGYIRSVISDVDGPGGELALTAVARKPERFVPLRHLKELEDGSTQVTRIGYAAYDFETNDGRHGLGIVEVLDQLVDGLPIGMQSGR
ncbi:hypothetical protein SAMN05892883_1567 [Jatrophihabitans sp. GAS493]|uniref:DUF7064 domain-containing protein n=1 Tax=Jatrophihabitans sp. GAS493 TaxID=1907575 RepID=UPI000BB8155C|nr:hypothetical protein [Jatrophihabitans sp. GAS493]SOD72140.1 hypothetical protein SAMN05892883_1567 [Jatrophihabitans sp. GAS493]